MQGLPRSTYSGVATTSPKTLTTHMNRTIKSASPGTLVRARTQRTRATPDDHDIHRKRSTKVRARYVRKHPRYMRKHPRLIGRRGFTLGRAGRPDGLVVDRNITDALRY